MGCGSSQVSSNPSSQVKPSPLGNPDRTVVPVQEPVKLAEAPQPLVSGVSSPAQGQTPVEPNPGLVVATNLPSGSVVTQEPAAATEGKKTPVEFVPATNIQYEIPEAFKDKAPLVPVGFPTIASLQTVDVPLSHEQTLWVTGVSQTGEVPSEMFCIQALVEFQYGQNFWFDTQLKLVKQSEQTKYKFSRLLSRDREYWYEMECVRLVVGGAEHTLEGNALRTPQQNGQFWGDYLFFVSDANVLQAVEIKSDGSISQNRVSPFSEEGDFSDLSRFEICPEGKSMIALLTGGELADGIQILPEYSQKLGQFQATKKVHMRSFGYEEAFFYNFHRTAVGSILAFAESSDNKSFIALMNASLEALHILIFAQPETEPWLHKPSIIREDSWRGHPLIISAREIFEIDLFLIAKNQIMHLQTFASAVAQTDLAVNDEFKSLSKVAESWYLGSPLKKEFPLLRKLIWN